MPLCQQDVPSNYLEQLSKIWKLQSIDYIDGVPALYTTKGTRFDGVFTKLSVTWRPKSGSTFAAFASVSSRSLPLL